MPGAILIKKASQSLRPQTRKMKTIFHRHMRAAGCKPFGRKIEDFSPGKKNIAGPGPAIFFTM